MASTDYFSLDPEQKREYIANKYGLTDEELSILSSPEDHLPNETANTMIENFLMRKSIPVEFSPEFLVDGHELAVPLATSDASLPPLLTKTALLARQTGGFKTAAGLNVCSGQAVFIINEIIPDFCQVDSINNVTFNEELTNQIIAVANSTMPSMVKRGGGCLRLESRIVQGDSCKLLVIEIVVNVCDAMGANCVTTASDAVKAFVSEKFNLKPLMGILSNLSTNRIVSSRAKWPGTIFEPLKGGGIASMQALVNASEEAKIDPTKGRKHLKRIMDAITAVVEVTGNDTRAVEAAVHTYAQEISDNPILTHFEIDENGDLFGEIRLPIPVGIVGGSIKRSPTTSIMKKLLKVESANDLAKAIAAVGLASSFGAFFEELE